MGISPVTYNTVVGMKLVVRARNRSAPTTVFQPTCRKRLR